MQLCTSRESTEDAEGFNMKKPHAHAVRDYLRQREDGATINDILRALPTISCDRVARKVLEQMPDAYIDRWDNPKRGQWQAVWCVVTPPPHCPYPTQRFTPETRWVGAQA